MINLSFDLITEKLKSLIYVYKLEIAFPNLVFLVR